ncbi:metal ABC transporter ATP-binding protein [Mahella australiensis]|uniref:ABC transporter related protein n=1 Tax=Mahella australiensis (strain DSM 15567 / CIP 107919 / 50-1 BON) TaxID=697281 RepID=F4A1R3_MAHA5|nr:metal ABC transporter ATP-binding protein [Mahella australiensis]AEE97113.1 ABC transporter related protein [Mahella australiensis 50-1 BON]
MSSAIEISNVTFAYEDKTVLENISLTIEQGEFSAIIGPNGSGKSTLINIMVGLLTPNSGSVRIAGHNIGYLPQRSFAFNQAFPADVKEVVSMGLYTKVGLFRRLKKSDWGKVYDTLGLVDMLDYKDKLIGHLSGGQQQRVFIARALVSDPQILFLDEPTVGVDAKSQQALFDLLEKLNKERGITIVMVTHDVWVITDKVNRVICMGNGHIYPNCSLDNMDAHMLSELYGYPIKLESHVHRS